MKLNILKRKISHNDIGTTALFVAYNSDIEKMKRLSQGQVVSCEVKRERNLKHHNLYFALCRLVSDNSDFISEDQVDYYVRIKSGLVDFQIVCDEKTIVKPKSLQFAKMNQSEFEKFFDRVIPLFEKITGLTKKELLNNLMEYM